MGIYEQMKLKRLIDNSDEILIDECGWVKRREFYIWVSFYNLEKAVSYLMKYFGSDLFYNTDFNTHINHDYACINLSTIFEYEELLEVFPINEYEH